MASGSRAIDLPPLHPHGDRSVGGPGDRSPDLAGRLSVSALRREYERSSLDEKELDPDPVRQFGRWLQLAIEAGIPDATAMALATATRTGDPAARMVLLKAYDQRGFFFYTDYESRKGSELAENPRAELLFYWTELERQVRVHGTVERIGREESEAYFHTRPRSSQVAAWASRQSRAIPDRAALEARIHELEERFRGDEIPLPPYWGGYRVVPDSIEFWQGRAGRLHDRIRYTLQEIGRWHLDRLSP